jgi:hypothetical protein
MTLPIDSDKNDDASLAGGSSHIRGNLPADVKQTLETVLHKVMGRAPVFGSSIDRRVVITEASIVPKAEEASRTEARVVCEVTVGEGKVCLARLEIFLLLMATRDRLFRHAQPGRKPAWWLRCFPD